MEVKHIVDDIRTAGLRLYGHEQKMDQDQQESNTLESVKKEEEEILKDY